VTRCSRLATLVLGLALGGALVAAHRGFAQDPPAPKARLGPYEYKVVSMLYSDYQEKADWKEILEKHERNALRADAAFKEYVINHHAKEGYELVQVLTPKPELTVLYLRRAR
jgi:hypothetical protein